MKDSPDEIASIMNLILPAKNELPIGEKFLDEYMEKKGVNIYTVKENKIKKLKQLFKGRVSFIKAIQSSVTKTYKLNLSTKSKNLFQIYTLTNHYELKYTTL